MHRTVSLVGLFALMPALVVAGPSAVLDGRALREECSASSQPGMRGCLAKKVEISQTALKQAEEKMANAIAKWDEDSKYVVVTKAKYIASNEAFSKYREKQCEFSASLSGGAAGNAHDIGLLACTAELNNRRAAQLGDAVADLPLK